MARLWIVRPADARADDAGPGDAATPLRTAGAAADRALPGDTVRLGPGTYRERVAPATGGMPDAPVTYEAEVPGTAVLKSSDLWQPHWQAAPGGLLRAALPPALVQSAFNPFAQAMPDRLGGRCLGELFLAGQPWREVDRPDDLERVASGWCPVDGGTAILARAPEAGWDRAAPVLELVCRPYVFAPRRRGLGYLVVRGLTLEHCANPFPRLFWEPEGTPQAGALSTRSGHHWTVEDCLFRFAKGLGLDCGAEGGRDPEGAEPAPALTGHHLIRRNTFEGHGVGGIAGWITPGTVITGNSVRACNRLGFFAPEAAGIKLHQCFGALVEGNLVVDNDAFGIWLDNGYVGSRVTRNVCLRNRAAGIFIEMGRGPCLVDHNVCGLSSCGEGVYCHDASDVTIAHNLLFGNAHFGVYARKVTERRCMDDLPPPAEEVGAARLRVLNNLFIDNHRGQLCLPCPGAPLCADNRSDHNLFVAAAGWHWEGPRTSRFVLSANDGRVPREQVAGVLASAGLDPARAAAPDDPVLDLVEWRGATGWDRHSREVRAQRGEIEVGAVAKGAFGLAVHDGYFHCRDGAFLAADAPPLPELSGGDLYGRPRPPGPVRPGPFAEAVAGLNRFPLGPRPA